MTKEELVKMLEDHGGYRHRLESLMSDNHHLLFDLGVHSLEVLTITALSNKVAVRSRIHETWEDASRDNYKTFFFEIPYDVVVDVTADRFRGWAMGLYNERKAKEKAAMSLRMKRQLLEDKRIIKRLAKKHNLNITITAASH